MLTSLNDYSCSCGSKDYLEKTSSSTSPGPKQTLRCENSRRAALHSRATHPSLPILITHCHRDLSPSKSLFDQALLPSKKRSQNTCKRPYTFNAYTLVCFRRLTGVNSIFQVNRSYIARTDNKKKKFHWNVRLTGVNSIFQADRSSNAKTDSNNKRVW